MAKFTTRVELHGYLTADDYETLHKEMASRGYIRTITNMDTNAEYQLPAAEYNLIKDCTVDDALHLAINAAKITGKKHSVLVTESINRRWIGLDEA